MGKKIVAALFFIVLTLSLQGCEMSQPEYEEAEVSVEQNEEAEKPIEESEIEAKVVAVSRTYSDWNFAYMVLYYSETLGYDEVYISSTLPRHSIEFDDSKDALYISKDKNGYIYRLVLTPETYKNAPIFLK